MAERKKRGKNKNQLEGIKPSGFKELIKSDKVYRYKEVCKILNIPVLKSGSSSQIKQLKQLNTLCEYEKEKGKFRFIRMRNKKDTEVFQHQMTYTKLIKYSLIQALSKPETQEKMDNGMLFVSMSEIMEMCGMVNENFDEIRKASNYKAWTIMVMHYKDFGKCRVTAEQLKRFTRISYDILKALVRDAIKSMSNEQAVTMQSAYAVYRKTDDGSKITKYILATSYEGQELLKICDELLKEVGIKNMQSLYFTNRNKTNEYYTRRNELCKERLGYDGVCDFYAIGLNENYSEYIPNVKYAKALNLRIQDRLLNANQFNDLSVKFKSSLINTMIALDTSYDFKKDYEIAQGIRAGK